MTDLSWTLPFSSPRVTVTVRTLCSSKEGSYWWKSEVTHPTHTLPGSCPGKMRTEKKYWPEGEDAVGKVKTPSSIFNMRRYYQWKTQEVSFKSSIFNGLIICGPSQHKNNLLMLKMLDVVSTWSTVSSTCCTFLPKSKMNAVAKTKVFGTINEKPNQADIDAVCTRFPG